jgi:hypothetical protein
MRALLGTLLIACNLGCTAEEPGRLGDAPASFLVSADHQHVVLLSGSTARSIDLDTGGEVSRLDGLFAFTDTALGYLSPDGAHYVAWTPQGQLFAMPVAGGSPVYLGIYTPQSGYPSGGPWINFSPDSSLVAVPSNPQSAGFVDVSVVPVGGGPALFTGQRQPLDYGMTFVVDQRLLYRAPDNSLMLMQLNVNPLEAVPVATTGGPLGTYAVSPDGRLIAYQDDHGLQVAPLAGGPATLMLPPDPSSSLSYAFSADGGHLVVEASASTNRSVSILPTAGGDAMTFPATSVARIHGLVLAGDRVLLMQASGSVLVASMSGYPTLALGTLQGVLGNASPDGNWVTVANPSPVPGCPNCATLELVSTRNGASWDVADDKGLLPISSLDFSPDSTSLLVVGAGQREVNGTEIAGGDLWRVPIQGGTLLFVEQNVDGASWVDAHRLVFLRRTGSNTGLYLRDVQ